VKRTRAATLNWLITRILWPKTAQHHNPADSLHSRLIMALARPNSVPNMKKRLIHNEMICGNKPVEEPLNIKREISRFQNNPLDPLIEFIGVSELIKHGDIGRYYRSFEFYAFSLERVLRAISVGRRFQRQVQPYYGCSQKFSPLQKKYFTSIPGTKEIL